MKPLHLIGATVAVLLAFFWLTCIRGGVSTTTNAMIATRDLATGTVIRDADVRMVEVDEKQLPKDVPRDFGLILGHEVTVPIAKGQFILSTELSADAKVKQNFVPIGGPK